MLSVRKSLLRHRKYLVKFSQQHYMVRFRQHKYILVLRPTTLLFLVQTLYSYQPSFWMHQAAVFSNKKNQKTKLFIKLPET